MPCSKFFQNERNFEAHENQNGEDENVHLATKQINEIEPEEINLNKYRVEAPV